jgi:hypothetical protein
MLKTKTIFLIRETLYMREYHIPVIRNSVMPEIPAFREASAGMTCKHKRSNPEPADVFHHFNIA